MAAIQGGTQPCELEFYQQAGARKQKRRLSCRRYRQMTRWSRLLRSGAPTDLLVRHSIPCVCSECTYHSTCQASCPDSHIEGGAVREETLGLNECDASLWAFQVPPEKSTALCTDSKAATLDSLDMGVAGSYFMWRVPTQNLVKGKPGGTKKKSAGNTSAVPNTG